MRLSIVVSDRAISIDGDGLGDIREDMSWIPNDVHAVQWDSDNGHIEFKNHIKPNEFITELGIYEQAIQTLVAEKKRRIVEQQEEEEALDMIRDFTAELKSLRTNKLSACDWTAVNDNKLDTSTKTAWEEYRQALRDLPDNVTDHKSLVKNPNHPDWPIPPN